jgi:hypothetical protein
MGNLVVIYILENAFFSEDYWDLESEMIWKIMLLGIAFDSVNTLKSGIDRQVFEC